MTIANRHLEQFHFKKDRRVLIQGRAHRGTTYCRYSRAIPEYELPNLMLPNASPKPPLEHRFHS